MCQVKWIPWAMSLHRIGTPGLEILERNALMGMQHQGVDKSFSLLLSLGLKLTKWECRHTTSINLLFLIIRVGFYRGYIITVLVILW